MNHPGPIRKAMPEIRLREARGVTDDVVFSPGDIVTLRLAGLERHPFLIMAAAPPEIRVYASFPSVVESADINVDPTNWRWVHCLILPLETLNARQFSPRPYKWIRYAIGVVVGAEGDLSSSPDSPNVVDCNAGVPQDPAVLYYHISDKERRRMFPVDPDIGRTNITSSVATTRRAQFRDDVAERDGRECVLTGLEETYCDAVHLLAHSKGDAVCYSYSQVCPHSSLQWR